MRSGAPVKSASCAAAIRGAATRPESLGVQVEKATITARAARGAKRMGHGLRRGKPERATRRRERQARLVQAAAARELPDQIADYRLGVAEQHACVVVHVQLVVDPGEAGLLAPLDGEDRPRLVGID